MYTNIFDNGELLIRMPEGSEYAAWYEQIVRNHSAYQVLRKGDIPFSNDHMKIEVLWPPSISDDRDYNENTLVLLLTIFRKKILLMGDVLKSIEKIMLTENLLPKDVDVLKVGHHGAEDATSEEFLVRIAPRYAIITGSGNMRHPYQHPDTLKRLEKYSERVFIVHKTGTITYTVNSKGEEYIGTH
jgi:competence protein ComEC